MRDVAGSRFAELVADDMAMRGFHAVTSMHPVDQDVVVTMFSDTRMAWSGPYTVVVVMASGLELMQNADHLPEFARARVAAAVKAYRDDREDGA
jgi:hypothetical protein